MKLNSPNQKQSLAAAVGRNCLAVYTAELRVVKETSCRGVRYG